MEASRFTWLDVGNSEEKGNTEGKEYWPLLLGNAEQWETEDAEVPTTYVT